MASGGQRRREEIRGRWLQLLAAVETARELDAARCASLLAEKTGLRAGMADTFHRAELLRSGAAGPVADHPVIR